MRLAFSPLTKRTPSKSGYPRIKTLHLPLTQAILPSLKVTFPPLKSSKEVKKNLSPVTCLEHPLYHSLGALALRAVQTTLHLGLSFLTQICLTSSEEVEEFFQVLGLRLFFFPFLVCRICSLESQTHPLVYSTKSHISQIIYYDTSTLSVQTSYNKRIREKCQKGPHGQEFPPYT